LNLVWFCSSSLLMCTLYRILLCTVRWTVVTGANYEGCSYFTWVGNFQLHSNFVKAVSSAKNKTTLSQHIYHNWNYNSTLGIIASLWHFHLKCQVHVLLTWDSHLLMGVYYCIKKYSVGETYLLTTNQIETAEIR